MVVYHREVIMKKIIGRKSVGKTYLIREFFSHKEIYFEMTGIKDFPMASQLKNFVLAFSQTFVGGRLIIPPSHWEETFTMLTQEFPSISSSNGR